MQQYKINSSISQILHCSRQRLGRPGTRLWTWSPPWVKQNCTKYSERTLTAMQHSTNKPSFVKTIDTIPGISDHDKAQNNKNLREENMMMTETNAFCTDFITMYQDRNVETNWDLLASHLKKMQHTPHPHPLAHNQAEADVSYEASAFPQTKKVIPTQSLGSLQAHAEWDMSCTKEGPLILCQWDTQRKTSTRRHEAFLWAH